MRKKVEKSYSTSISGVGIVERYTHFVKAIKELKRPNKAAIINYLSSRGDIISERTFFRIKSELEEGLGIKIGYDKNKGYFVKEESAKDLERLLHLSGLALQEGQVKQALLNNPNLFDYVLFDAERQEGYSHNLSILMEALLKMQKVDVHYQKHSASQPKLYSNLEPHYVKKYLGRWYVISYDSKSSRPLTLALDERMHKVEMNDGKFERKEGSFNRIHQVVGLNYSQGEIDFGISEPIEITFEVNQGFVPFIKSLPIHNSQQFIKQLNSGNCVFSLRLIPNYELVQAFFRIGDQTKVLSPPFFVEYFKNCVDGVLKRY